MSVKKTTFAAGLALALACLAGRPAPALADAIDVQTVTSISPNPNSPSPSVDGWVTNALAGLQSGPGPAGTPGTPTYFSPVNPANVTPSDMIVTAAPNTSWMGQANPTGAFANEYGNLLVFSLAAHASPGTTFKIDNVALTITSTIKDPAFQAFLASLNAMNGFGGWVSDPGSVGFLGGTQINSPASGQELDTLFTIGQGIAFDASDFPGSGQTQIDNLLAQLAAEEPFTITGTWTVLADNGQTFTASSTVSFAAPPVPEPGTLLLGLTAGAGLLARRLFRRRRC